MSPKERLALIMLLILGIAATFATTLFWERADTAMCEARYARARSAADSARIDQTEALAERGRGRVTDRVTCGEWRRMQGEAPGALLKAGMTLTYGSGGELQPPWMIDTVRAEASGMPGARCIAVSLRRDPTAPIAAADRYCLAPDTLYRWSTPQSRWEVSRPVGPSMRWTTTRPNGDTVHYMTAERAQATVGTQALDVVQTSVTTVDSLGRPKARLRERYALGLLTAIGGTFEAPDSASPGTWVARRSFELTAITPPQ